MKPIKFSASILFSTIFSLMLLNPSDTLAQQTETLFSGDVTHGGFGGPVVKLGSVADETAVWIGGRGGWIISFDRSNTISLGGGGYGLVTDHQSPIDPDLYALAGYGGFEVEYTNQSYRVAHFTISSLIGGGGLLLRERDFEEVEEDVDSFFVFEPAANVEVNVTHFFRISAGVSYRLTSGIGRFGFSDSDFSGFNGVITFKFGKFL